MFQKQIIQMAILFICIAALTVSSAAADIFFDDFSSGLSFWTQSTNQDQDNYNRWTQPGVWNAEILHTRTGYPSDGSYAPAAHADNCDAGCTLTLANSIDLSDVDAAILRFLRFVDSSIDSGEYLTVDLYDGESWQTVFFWTENNGDDDQWHLEEIDLRDYAGTDDFRIRFTTQSSSAYEHVQIDDVRIVSESITDRQVSRQNIEDHVLFLTQNPRTPGSAHLAASQEYCAAYLEEQGFTVEIQPFSSGSYSGQNVIGTKIGTTHPDEVVMISAHIDHIANCSGADDNASGVSGLLESARLLAAQNHARTLVAACWDLEEVGLLGSKAYAEHAQNSGEQIIVNFVFDMIGYKDDTENSQNFPDVFGSLYPMQYSQLSNNQFRGDFIGIAVDTPGFVTPEGGRQFVEDFNSAAADIGLPVMSIEVGEFTADVLSEVLRSDHGSFWNNGFTALMITDTAANRNPNYHCQGGEDNVATLNFDFMQQVTQATIETAEIALNR